LAFDILIPAIAVLLFSLSFHEAAHAWSADRLGDPTARTLGRLTLNPISHIDPIGTVLFPLLAILSGLPLIGWAKPVPVNWHNLPSPRRDFALVALAGPASNLILAVGFALLLAVLPLEPGGTLWQIVATGIILNVLLAVFNMLPVPPLDGGNVLAGFVPEPVARAIDQLRPWGFLILYALLFLGVFERIVWPVQRVIQSWLM
jgi:Zn-dependent protease